MENVIDIIFYEKEKELMETLSLDELVFIGENFKLDSGYIKCSISKVTPENIEGLENLVSKNVACFDSDKKFGGYVIFNRHIHKLLF